MSNYQERTAIRDKWALHVKRATTYLRTARDLLYGDYKGMTAISTLPTEYWYLLDLTLDAATEIIERLPDDFFVEKDVDDMFGLVGGRFKFNSSDEVYEAAKKLLALIEKRRGGGKLLRLIEMLEATEGRTPEEAESFRAHADRLREKLRSGT